MQNSRVAINEAGPTSVVVDFHNAAWELTARDQPYGYAFQKTVEHLGLKPNLDTSEGFTRLHLSGSTESVKDHISDLNRHIGIIAHTSARIDKGFMPVRQEYIGRLLGNLTQHAIPSLPHDATLMRTTGIVMGPFAEAVSTDLTEVFYARKPYWHGTSEPAKHEDGTLMRRFDARDIGGLLIGWDGLPTQEFLSFVVPVDKTQFDTLRLIAAAKDVNVGSEMRDAFRRHLNSSSQTISKQPTATETNTRLNLNLRRTDLQKLYDIDFEEGANAGDLFYHAMAAVIESAQADEDLQAKVNEYVRSQAELF